MRNLHFLNESHHKGTVRADVRNSVVTGRLVYIDEHDLKHPKYPFMIYSIMAPRNLGIDLAPIERISYSILVLRSGRDINTHIWRHILYQDRTTSGGMEGEVGRNDIVMWPRLIRELSAFGLGEGE